MSAGTPRQSGTPTCRGPSARPVRGGTRRTTAPGASAASPRSRTTYLSYFGLRVRDPRRSEQFYWGLFGLDRVDGPDWSVWSPAEPACLLLRDPRSGQRLELNYYPASSPYGGPCAAGEELDHLAFRVDDLAETLRRLEELGQPAERMAHYEGPILQGPTTLTSFARDPDGIQLELFQAVVGEPVAYDPARY